MPHTDTLDSIIAQVRLVRLTERLLSVARETQDAYDQYMSILRLAPATDREDRDDE